MRNTTPVSNKIDWVYFTENARYNSVVESFSVVEHYNMRTQLTVMEYLTVKLLFRIFNFIFLYHTNIGILSSIYIV